MTELPKLENWQETKRSLHQAAQVIGGVRKVVADPEPNWVHLGLLVTAEGVTTGPLPQVGTLTLSFVQRAIIHEPLNGAPRTMPLAGHSQITLADMVDEALAQTGTLIHLDRGKVSARTPFVIDATLAAEYAVTLNWVHGLLTEFRTTLPDVVSKLVVWPHGFDISFLWFATEEVSEHAPHMAFGFSPGSEGLERPYFYAYAYPNPPELLTTPLPASAHWHTQGWTGMVADYDALGSDPTAAATAALRVTYEAAASLIAQSANQS